MPCVYVQRGACLYAQRVVAGAVSRLRLEPNPPTPHVVALGGKTMVVLDGLSLLQNARVCSSWVARSIVFDAEHLENQLPVVPTKRWDLGGIEQPLDVACTGAVVESAFDQLCGGQAVSPEPLRKYVVVCFFPCTRWLV